MTFRVGQKVVFIAHVADDVRACYPNASFPNKDGIYTIRGFGRRDEPGDLLLLQELDNGHLIGLTLNGFYCCREPGFSAEKFRPIVERKTDISIFTAMLNPSLEDVASHILNEVTLCP